MSGEMTSLRRTIVETIETRVHGRFLVDDGWPAGRHRLLVGFHGYGENAEKHKAELDRLGLDGWRTASVQALHPFYNTKTNEVIASWMTSLDRDLAIADNIAYVKSAVDRIEEESGRAETLVFIGFSQGVAMAYRAAASSGHACQGIVALAGDLPPDVKAAQANGLRLPRVLVGRGDGDTWYTAEVMERDLESLRDFAADVQTVVFQGGHEWTDSFRDGVRQFLRHL
jgi:predicted esterase